MNCKWVSRKDKNLKCNRHADSSGYCLFHKQNKSKREIALFDTHLQFISTSYDKNLLLVFIDRKFIYLVNFIDFNVCYL